MISGWKFIFCLLALMCLGLNSYAQLKPNEIDSGCIFIDSDEMPMLPKSVGDYQTYIKHNIKIPVRTDCSEGTVYIQAIVDTTGLLRDITLKKGICTAFNEEAMRLITNMPKFVPGKQNGKVVNMKITFPVSFKSEFYKD